MVVGKATVHVIYGFCGLPGSGKTLYCVYRLYALRKRNHSVRIFSNIPLYLPYGDPVPVFEQLNDVFDVRDAVIFLDEAHLALSSRAWQRHGPEFERFLSQMRKRHVTLFYTTQELKSVDRFLREKTFVSYWMESYVKLGFFTWTAFFGDRNRKDRRYLRGIFLFNPAIAACYDTDMII